MSLPEGVIGLFKTELDQARRSVGEPSNNSGPPPCTTSTWFDDDRLFEINGDLPPIELEQAYYRHNADLAEAG